MPLSQRYQTNHPKVISETIDGETIIINLDSGHYFSMNRSGGEIWNAIVNRCTLGEIVQGLVAQYGADETATLGTVQEFLDALTKENLISRTETAGASLPKPAPRAAETPGLPFEKPEFQRYDDMQDLLLLDPIHDVDETGWPKTAPQVS